MYLTVSLCKLRNFLVNKTLRYPATTFLDSYKSITRSLASASSSTTPLPPPPAPECPPSQSSHNASSSSSSPKLPQTGRSKLTADGPISWRSLTIGIGIFGFFTAYIYKIKKEVEEEAERERTKSYGKAAIGCEFELVDTTGKLRNSKEWLGKWILVYFGFTHCPDVCPEELEKIAECVARMQKRHGIEITPLFISVDPDRDTPELVAKYLSEFSDKFIGLTGTKEQVEKATRAYRVYYSVGPKDKDNDYIVDHTIISYLVNPEGELSDYFGQTKTVEDMESSIITRVIKGKSKTI